MRRAAVGSLAASFVLAGAGLASGQTPAPEPPTVQPFVRNWTRFELWNYFEPPAPTPTFTPGDPSTAHVGNRLQVGLRFQRGTMDATVALQYVQFGGLPAQASGPGALGTGAVYYDHSGDTASHQVFLKAAHVAFREIGRFELQVGRMPYTSGSERASGVAKIEAVKRQRIDSRLVGEFEWAIYQRAYDGLRVDWRGRRVQVTGTAFQPTQGGYEDAAGISMRDVHVFSGVVTTVPGLVLPRSEVQLFAHHYADDRAVTARPDTTGLQATRADVAITTIGGHLVGAQPVGSGSGRLVVRAEASRSRAGGRNGLSVHGCSMDALGARRRVVAQRRRGSGRRHAWDVLPDAAHHPSLLAVHPLLAGEPA
jgi:hypothetical protein